jgi:hypothetical protein
MLRGSTVTSTPSKAGCSAVAVGLGTSVGEKVVGLSGIWVGGSVGIPMVSVGNGAGLVGDATVTDRSHARDIRINKEMKKKPFFDIVMYIVEFPFRLTVFLCQPIDTDAQ